MWFKRKRLSEQFEGARKIKVKGIVFKIRKFNVFDYLEGVNVVQQIYDVYRRSEKSEASEASFKKVKAHYRDVFLAGVVWPELVRKEDEEGFFVDKLFYDWEFCHELYSRIIEHTYGKKKV